MSVEFGSDEWKSATMKRFLKARRAAVRLACEKRKMTERDFPLTFLRAAETMDPNLIDVVSMEQGLKPLQMSREQLFEVG